MKAYQLLCPALILFTTTLFIDNCAASTLSTSHQYHDYIDGLHTELGIGFLNGKAKEYVYEGEHKNSQLDWKIKHALLIKGAVTADFNPYLSANMQGWHHILKSDAKMNDYDWQIPSQSDWTNHSVHNDTKLNKTYGFDINLQGWFANQTNYKVGMLLGYLYNKYRFDAKGGEITKQNNQPTVIIIPDDLNVISYSQTFKTPYIGLISYYYFNQFEFSGQVKYSHWSKGKANDRHHLRNLSFQDTVKNAEYWAATLSARYHVSTNTALKTELTYQKYKLKRGNTAIFNHNTNTTTFDPENSGMENQNIMLFFGISYHF